jgi:hypothetical protein
MDARRNKPAHQEMRIDGEEINHMRRLHEALSRRQRERELQAAKLDIGADPAIIVTLLSTVEIFLF